MADELRKKLHPTQETVVVGDPPAGCLDWMIAAAIVLLLLSVVFRAGGR